VIEGRSFLKQSCCRHRSPPHLPRNRRAGTARISRDPATTRGSAERRLPQTLPLAPKEVVLDLRRRAWPARPTRCSTRVRNECVNAHFLAAPAAKRAAQPGAGAERGRGGHTSRIQTLSHPLSEPHENGCRGARERSRHPRRPRRNYGPSGPCRRPAADEQPKTPFFRFPGFATLALRDRHGGAQVHGIGRRTVGGPTGTRLTPNQQLRLVLARLDATVAARAVQRDQAAQTAALMPAFCMR